MLLQRVLIKAITYLETMLFNKLLKGYNLSNIILKKI